MHFYLQNVVIYLQVNDNGVKFDITPEGVIVNGKKQSLPTTVGKHVLKKIGHYIALSGIEGKTLAAF